MQCRKTPQARRVVLLLAGHVHCVAGVRLKIGDQTLTAIITRDAIDALRLKRGEEAVAVIKSTEVMVGRGGQRAEGRRQKAEGRSKK